MTWTALSLGYIVNGKNCYMFAVEHPPQKYRARSKLALVSLQATENLNRTVPRSWNPSHATTKDDKGSTSLIKLDALLILSITLWRESLLESTHCIFILASTLHRTATIQQITKFKNNL